MSGYDVTLAFAHVSDPSEWWREACAVVDAVALGGTAWARMSIGGDPASQELVLRRTHLSRPWGPQLRAGDSKAPSSVRLKSVRQPFFSMTGTSWPLARFAGDG
jgi:hypothetical protein